MTKFFFFSIFLLILGILFVEPFEVEDKVALYPETTPVFEEKKVTVTLNAVLEIEKAQLKLKKKRLGKRNSHQAMNSIKRDEPLVMENDIPFEPLK